jgi:2-polyprenyl-3-methyl-5-hydroxy-6-metoxy-1,4-benzoquinol methylase
MYISPERKKSMIKGSGIQYIPGHEEKFVDFIVRNYLPDTGNILDIGGGGFRFAIPVAIKGKSITVVDLDKDSLDLEDIVNRVNKNGKMLVELKMVQRLIQIKLQNFFDFLEKTKNYYSLITAFRVVHFCSPELISRFFILVYDKLDQNGIFAFSGITPYNFSNNQEFNEIYLNSTPIEAKNILFRKFESTPEANNIIKQQNLPSYIHLVDSQYIYSQARRYGFEVIESDLQSTRIVGGYVLKKLKTK